VPGAQGRTRPAHRHAKERERRRQRYRPALGPAQPGRRREGRSAQEWRATETVLAPPGDGATLWPYGPPGRHWCGLPVRCHTVGEHGASWVIHTFRSTVHAYRRLVSSWPELPLRTDELAGYLTGSLLVDAPAGGPDREEEHRHRDDTSAAMTYRRCSDLLVCGGGRAEEHTY